MQRYSLAFAAACALLAAGSAAWAATDCTNGCLQGVKVVSATDDSQPSGGPLCRNANGTQVSCFHGSRPAPTKEPKPHRHHHAPPEPPSAPVTK
jgi:hypothetical protein